jgi:hypothetical protein
MQKFVFAVKVFGIIILIPVLVILQLNHELPANKQHSVVDKRVDKTSTQLSLNTESRIENPIIH